MTRLMKSLLYRGLERHRLEAAGVGGLDLLVQIEAGIGEQLRGDLAGDPALRRQARFRIVLGAQVELRARPVILHHVPAVGGARRVVHE